MAKPNRSARAASFNSRVALRTTISLLALCMVGSVFAADITDAELRNFLPKLQAAAKRGPSAVVPMARFPLRVELDSYKVLMVSAAEFAKSYENIFTPNVLAHLARDTADDAVRDPAGVGVGAFYMEATCPSVAKCDHPVPLVTVIRVNIAPPSRPGVDYRETHCMYQYEGKSYPCSADNRLLRWLYVQKFLNL